MSYTNAVDYWRTHPETRNVALVEHALTQDPQTVREIARTAGLSTNFTCSVLEYLAAEKRCQRHPDGRQRATRWSLPRPR